MGKYGPEKKPYLDTFYTLYGEKQAVADTAAAVELAVTLTGFWWQLFHWQVFDSSYFNCFLYIRLRLKSLCTKQI